MKKIAIAGIVVTVLGVAGYYAFGNFAYNWFMDRSQKNPKHQLAYEGMAKFQELAESGALPGNDPRERWDASFPTLDLKDSSVTYPFDLEVDVTKVKDKNIHFKYTLRKGKGEPGASWKLAKAAQLTPSGEVVDLLK